MGDRSAHDPARSARRAQTVGERARGVERDLYVLWTGCQWKALPKDLPPKEHGARLSRALEPGRHLGAHPSRAVRGGARGGGS